MIFSLSLRRAGGPTRSSLLSNRRRASPGSISTIQCRTDVGARRAQQKRAIAWNQAMRRDCAASLSLASERARLAPLTRRRPWIREARSLRAATGTSEGGCSSSTKRSSAAEKRGTAGGRGRIGFLSQLRSSSMGYRRACIIIEPRLRLGVCYFAFEARRF